MLKISALLLALGVSGAAFAGPYCTVHPTSEWMSESAARAQIEAQGYKIAKFDIDDNCYEVDAYDKNGRQVEIHYDTKTLDVVRSQFD
jgi:hypothetical protein